MMLKHKKHRAVRKRLGSADLEVCWRDDAFGRGPCFSVYHHGREALRFDLFDRGAHWHSYREVNQPRHYFARDGQSFLPAAPDIEASARTQPAPPWDVLVNAAIREAVIRFPRVGDHREWLRAELAAARGYGEETRPARGV